MWVCVRRPASLAVVPEVCLRGSGCRCAGGVAAFFGPSGCVPFVLRSPSASLGPSGRLCEGGSSPFVCASPCRPRTLVCRVTTLIGEGSFGPGVRARACVSTLGFFVSRPFFLAWAPVARVGGPSLCHRPSPGGARPLLAWPRVLQSSPCPGGISRPGVRLSVYPPACRARILSNV